MERGRRRRGDEFSASVDWSMLGRDRRQGRATHPALEGASIATRGRGSDRSLPASTRFSTGRPVFAASPRGRLRGHGFQHSRPRPGRRRLLTGAPPSIDITGPRSLGFNRHGGPSHGPPSPPNAASIYRRSRGVSFPAKETSHARRRDRVDRRGLPSDEPTGEAFNNTHGAVAGRSRDQPRGAARGLEAGARSRTSSWGCALPEGRHRPERRPPVGVRAGLPVTTGGTTVKPVLLLGNASHRHGRQRVIVDRVPIIGGGRPRIGQPGAERALQHAPAARAVDPRHKPELYMP